MLTGSFGRKLSLESLVTEATVHHKFCDIFHQSLQPPNNFIQHTRRLISIYVTLQCLPFQTNPCLSRYSSSNLNATLPQTIPASASCLIFLVASKVRQLYPDSRFKVCPVTGFAAHRRPLLLSKGNNFCTTIKKQLMLRYD